MSIEDFIISVYCYIEDTYSQVIQQPLRRHGFQPKLSDSEVITIEIVGEFIGKDQDKAIWFYFKSHWSNYFPTLGSRGNFAKQCANLWSVKKQIFHYLSISLNTIH
jgi:ssDNA-specific exonuclease RecJ